MKPDTKSTQETNQEPENETPQESEPALKPIIKPASKPGSKIHVMKFILPGLLILLIVILFFRFAPVYQEKRKDIRQYNMMAEKYRMVEFEFYNEKDNPILKDEKYMNQREREYFAREFNKLSEEVRSSPGVAKARKIYNYVWTKYVDKRMYTEMKWCVIYLEKDSTYSNPVFQSKSEIEMNKKKMPWKAAQIIKSKFFKRHFIVEFIMGESQEVSFNEYEVWGMPTTNNRIVAIDRETSIGYELSDNRGDWLEYMHEISGVLTGLYGFFEPMEGKIKAFNQVALNEGIKIGNEKEALEYAKFFVSVFYGTIKYDYDPVTEPIPGPGQWHQRPGMDEITPIQVEKKENYYQINFCIGTIRRGAGSYWFDYGEVSSWDIKVYENGKIEGTRKVMAGGRFMEVWPFYNNANGTI